MAGFQQTPYITRNVRGWQPLGLCLGCLSLVVAWLLASSTPIFAQALDDDVLRERVKTSIERGQSFLLSKQNSDGSFDTGYVMNPVGANSLAGLALLTTGIEPSDPKIQKCLRYVRSLPKTTKTYDLGLAIMFFSAAGEERDRPQARLVGLVCRFDLLLRLLPQVRTQHGRCRFRASWGR